MKTKTNKEKKEGSIIKQYLERKFSESSNTNTDCMLKGKFLRFFLKKETSASK